MLAWNRKPTSQINDVHRTSLMHVLMIDVHLVSRHFEWLLFVHFLKIIDNNFVYIRITCPCLTHTAVPLHLYYTYLYLPIYIFTFSYARPTRRKNGAKGIRQKTSWLAGLFVPNYSLSYSYRQSQHLNLLSFMHRTYIITMKHTQI